MTISIVLPSVTRLLECLKLYEPSKGWLVFFNSKLLNHLLIKIKKKGNEFLKEIAEDMFTSLNTRTSKHFSNSLMLAATFMDPRYRSFKFIKDQSERDLGMFRAQKYIKTVYSDLYR